MEIRWFVQAGGQSYGPYLWQELWQMSRQGRLGPHDLIWNQAMAGWIPIGQVPGLGQVQPSSGSDVSRKKGNRGLVITLVALLILVALTGSAALIRQRPAENKKTDATTQQQSGDTARTTSPTSQATTATTIHGASSSDLLSSLDPTSSLDSLGVQPNTMMAVEQISGTWYGEFLIEEAMMQSARGKRQTFQFKINLDTEGAGIAKEEVTSEGTFMGFDDLKCEYRNGILLIKGVTGGIGVIFEGAVNHENGETFIEGKFIIDHLGSADYDIAGSFQMKKSES